jgi:hypothetical protein
MDAIVVLVFLAVLVGLFGIEAVPLLALSINGGRLTSYFENTEATAAALRRSALLAEWFKSLKDLGFAVLGVKAEKLPLWGPVFRELALASPGGEAYAGIVLYPDGSPASLYFYTPMRGGGMVFTRNFAGRELEAERTSVRNVQNADAAAIFNDHRARVDQFRFRGLTPAAGATQAARLDATTAFYESEYGRQSLPPPWSPPVQRFMIALVFLLVVAVWALAGGAPAE